MATYSMDFERPVIELEDKLIELKSLKGAQEEDVKREIQYLEGQLDKLKKLVYADLTPWQRVQIARHPFRPRTLDFINHIFSDFTELHGDRLFADDAAIVGGMGHLDGQTFMIIGHQKGKNAKTNIKRNFGMPNPEGYRKALRLMKMADKFKVPLITFIDTPGAFPGIGAEERGQAQTIALNLQEMGKLQIPVISINIGEGGSGGALAISICDELLMLENSYYSVITPEACASILWHDESKAAEAAQALKMTAVDLKRLGIVDTIINEPLGGAHRDPELTFYNAHRTLLNSYQKLSKLPVEKLLEKRWKKIRGFGVFEKSQQVQSQKSKIDS